MNNSQIAGQTALAGSKCTKDDIESVGTEAREGGRDFLQTDKFKQFVDLFEKEGDSLRRFLRAKLPNREDADDLAQEAYLRLYEANRLNGIRSLNSFLYRVATNLVIDTYRAARTKSLEINSTYVDALLESTAEETTTEDRVAIEQELKIIERVIDELPPRCQQVFVMHRFKQMTHSEISKELKISTQMVEKHIAKAVHRCREALRKLK